MGVGGRCKALEWRGGGSQSRHAEDLQKRNRYFKVKEGEWHVKKGGDKVSTYTLHNPMHMG